MTPSSSAFRRVPWVSPTTWRTSSHSSPVRARSTSRARSSLLMEGCGRDSPAPDKLFDFRFISTAFNSSNHRLTFMRSCSCIRELRSPAAAAARARSAFWSMFLCRPDWLTGWAGPRAGPVAWSSPPSLHSLTRRHSPRTRCTRSGSISRHQGSSRNHDHMATGRHTHRDGQRVEHSGDGRTGRIESDRIGSRCLPRHVDSSAIERLRCTAPPWHR